MKTVCSVAVFLVAGMFAGAAQPVHTLPTFVHMRGDLPAPVLDREPKLVEMYWKAWELAFRNFHQPAKGSGFPSNFIDAAFNQNIFLWDTCFMTMFCNYAHPLVPGIGSLDNFYAKQHATGEISREIDRTTGEDYKDWQNREREPLFSRWGYGIPGVSKTPVVYLNRPAPEPNPALTLDALNHPLLAWAELESYRVTGDHDRLRRVWNPLVRYYEALRKYLQQGNGLYMTDWASMDNSPRNACLAGGGTGVDTSAEMALFARNLAEIAQFNGQKSEAARFAQDADEISERINRLMWDPARGFYFDLRHDGHPCAVMTVAAYWTLLSRTAPAPRADALASQLSNPETFGRPHRVPTLAASDKAYQAKGGYWRGSVWDPTELMVIRGLEAVGHAGLARRIALEHLDAVAEVFGKTGTIWENYAPDAPAPGDQAKNDFVGWSGITPILVLLEYKIGLKPDASRNELHWTLTGAGRLGCERFRFNGHTVTLIAEPGGGAARRWRIRVRSDGPFRLVVQSANRKRMMVIRQGERVFTL